MAAAGARDCVPQKPGTPGRFRILGNVLVCGVSAGRSPAVRKYEAHVLLVNRRLLRTATVPVTVKEIMFGLANIEFPSQRIQTPGEIASVVKDFVDLEFPTVV